MQLTKQSFEILEQELGIEGIVKQIELAGRTCYNSTDKITKDSAQAFLDMLIKSGHFSCLEHGTVYLYYSVPRKAWRKETDLHLRYYKNKFSKVGYNYDEDTDMDNYYVTTNYRVIIENQWADDLKYISEPTEFHSKRHTVRFITDIGISRELNRHRVNSIAEQSTRYCNYSKDKYGNKVHIILPDEIEEVEIKDSAVGYGDLITNLDCFHGMCQELGEMGDETFNIIDTWLFANLASEWAYLRLLNLGWKPQQARRVLPLDTKTELIHTAFDSDWQHLFDLRSSNAKYGKPHPDMILLIDDLQKEFHNRGYLL